MPAFWGKMYPFVLTSWITLPFRSSPEERKTKSDAFSDRWAACISQSARVHTHTQTHKHKMLNTDITGKLQHCQILYTHIQSSWHTIAHGVTQSWKQTCINEIKSAKQQWITRTCSKALTSPIQSWRSQVGNLHDLMWSITFCFGSASVRLYTVLCWLPLTDDGQRGKAFSLVRLLSAPITTSGMWSTSILGLIKILLKADSSDQSAR